ncbi:retrovirus-related pol polyprotein from transposon TNT 1-94 [Tanacetum coccineum]
MLEMKMGEPDYFGRAMVTENNMRNCGEDMDDVKIVEKILRTLRENFNFVVCSIEESKDIDKLTVDELQSSLLVHKQKGGDEQVLKIEYDSNFRRGSYWGRGRGRTRPDFNKLQLNAKNMKRLKTRKHGSLTMAVNHMTGNKDWFVQIDDSFKHTVKLGNNSRLAVTGKGNIRLEVQGITQTITNVYLVRELTANLDRRAPVWMQAYKNGAEYSDEEANLAMFSSQDDPDSFEEAPKEEKWVEAMKSELRAMEKNKTWELVALPAGAKKIGVKWVFKTKLSEDGKLNKYKVRLVVKGL